MDEKMETTWSSVLGYMRITYYFKSPYSCSLGTSALLKHQQLLVGPRPYCPEGPSAGLSYAIGGLDPLGKLLRS